MNLKVSNNSNWSMTTSDFKIQMPFITLEFKIKLPKASMSILISSNFFQDFYSNYFLIVLCMRAPAIQQNLLFGMKVNLVTMTVKNIVLKQSLSKMVSGTIYLAPGKLVLSVKTRPINLTKLGHLADKKKSCLIATERIN